MTMGDFAKRAGGTLVGVEANRVVHGFALDSREVALGSLFLCIQGDRSDGHDFARAAIDSGATACMAERDVPAPHIRVDRVVDALASFAMSKRQEFSGPVIAITGSNGKTSTKEFLAAALSPLGPVLKSPGNRNTEYTAPLLWADLRPDHVAVVAELAMRGLGQIDHLATFTQPTIAVITMIGTAHLEKVGSRKGIAQAKAEVLEHLTPDGIAIQWAEDDFLPYLRGRAPGTVRTFGNTSDADMKVVGYRPLSWRTCEISVQHESKIETFELKTVGKHQALNAAAALLTAVECGVALSDAVAAIGSADLPPMRMEIRQWNGVTIVLDNYNASPDSGVAALRTLCELPTDGRKLAVLGEMKELGSASESGHRLLGRSLMQSEPDEVLLYGDETEFIRDEALQLGFPKDRIRTIVDLNQVTLAVQALQPGDTVLVKGSRALHLEDAIEALP